jgi:hypothetical protein
LAYRLSKPNLVLQYFAVSLDELKAAYTLTSKPISNAKQKRHPAVKPHGV